MVEEEWWWLMVVSERGGMGEGEGSCRKTAIDSREPIRTNGLGRWQQKARYNATPFLTTSLAFWPFHSQLTPLPSFVTCTRTPLPTPCPSHSLPFPGVFAFPSHRLRLVAIPQGLVAVPGPELDVAHDPAGKRGKRGREG